MIDVSEHISAARREVGGRVLAAGQARVVTVPRSYPAELADVWDACTNPERIPRWCLPVSGELKEGGRYQLEGNAGGTVTRCDPPHGFDATWEMDGDISWIELRLADEGHGRTLFRLDRIAHLDDGRWAQFGPGAVGVGWESGASPGRRRPHYGFLTPACPSRARGSASTADRPRALGCQSACTGAATYCCSMPR
jgi:uncharacterized protein YndB with AHSA1/START domain